MLDVRKRSVQALRQSLKISNEESDEMQGTLDGLGLLLARRSRRRVATLKRFLARPTAALSRALLDALAGGDVGAAPASSG